MYGIFWSKVYPMTEATFFIKGNYVIVISLLNTVE